jgi:hypothetical protein
MLMVALDPLLRELARDVLTSGRTAASAGG